MNIAKAYVREMLDLNPMIHSPQILRRRRELWSVAAANPESIASGPPVHSPTQDPVADARLRDRARQCLEVLQSQFYQLPGEKLDQYLGGLESERLPEYAATASRLRAASKVRNVLNQTLRETKDAKFAFSLQHSVVRPPSESGALREQYIESIIEEKRVVRATKMVRAYAAAHPDVLELQRDWFDDLLDPDNQKAWAAKYSLRGRARASLGSGIGWGGVLLLIVISLIRGIAGISDGKPSRPNQTPPSWNGGAQFNPIPPQRPVPGLPSELTGGPATPTIPAMEKFDPFEYTRQMQERMELNRRRFRSSDPPNFTPPTFTPPNFTPPNFTPPNFPAPLPGGGGFQ